MRPLLVFLVLGAFQFYLRPPPPSRAQAHLARRFPGVVHSVVLGGFRPVVIQWAMCSARSRWTAAMRTEGEVSARLRA